LKTAARGCTSNTPASIPTVSCSKRWARVGRGNFRENPGGWLRKAAANYFARNERDRKQTGGDASMFEGTAFRIHQLAKLTGFRPRSCSTVSVLNPAVSERMRANASVMASARGCNRGGGIEKGSKRSASQKLILSPGRFVCRCQAPLERQGRNRICHVRRSFRDVGSSSVAHLAFGPDRRPERDRHPE
jgi:hypothetical protein